MHENAYAVCVNGVSKGGGAFFGKVGSFEEGYEFDGWLLNNTITDVMSNPITATTNAITDAIILNITNSTGL